MSDTSKDYIVERIREQVAWLDGWPQDLVERMPLYDLLREAADTIIELRAELAAERGEPEGALPGWVWNGSAWVKRLGATRLTVRRRSLMGQAPVWVTSVGITGGGIFGVEPDMQEGFASSRAAMRAAEAEARRLGLLGEVKP